MHNIFSREEQEIPLLNGRLNSKKVGELLSCLLPVTDIDEAFICGPGGMIDEVEIALKNAGLDQKKIHLERFGVANGEMKHRAIAGDAPKSTITVIADGLKRDVEFREGDESILDVALKSGMDLPFSCKGGVCNTCRCKVLEGKVRMGRNFALESDDLEAGFVLSCQSHPLTDRVVISFDNR
jgi:ring-1,2-phenylacetyl-CoA epoxidase subunit PaaE